jgi:hypothetical protein
MRRATVTRSGSYAALALALVSPAPLLAQAAPEPKAVASAPAAAAAPAADGSAPIADAATPAAEAPKPAAPAGPPDSESAAILAYQSALAKQRLAATEGLSVSRLREDLLVIEAKLVDGRRDEAIADLVYLVESPRFPPFAKSDEGRRARFLLGDALGRAGAHDLARAYLLGLLEGSPSDTWYRQAVHSLIDFGLESDRPRVFLSDLAAVPDSAGDEIRGDLAYLAGRSAELDGKPAAALAEYQKVAPRSRFWAQATYLSGVIEVERKQWKRGEELFCRIADPKRTPKEAALFGGGEFFRVRDLSRLGLGRVAHEQYRFDDARYYYYLVPADSERLPEALYETATTRYEAKDYDGARESMDELKRGVENHPYEDEAWILDAYIDLAVCRFPEADRKLHTFLGRYEPVRDAARRLKADPDAMSRLTAALSAGQDPASAGLGVPEGTARALGALLRLDSGYGRATKRLTQLDHQVNGLLATMGHIDEARRRLASPKDVRAQAEGPMDRSAAEQAERVRSQLSELRRLLRDAERAGRKGAELDALKNELQALELAARNSGTTVAPEAPAVPAGSGDLAGLLAADRKRASELHGAAEALRAAAERQQRELAIDAFDRLDKRLSRLLRRARLGRIETVLGKKRSLEIEIEALSQGLLPQTIVDSLDAARYLGDDEEYWPFEGEDWEDEYVGGEGLR